MSRFTSVFDKVLEEDGNVAGLGGVFDGGAQTNLGGAMTPLGDTYAPDNQTLPFVLGTYDRYGKKRKKKKKSSKKTSKK